MVAIKSSLHSAICIITFVILSLADAEPQSHWVAAANNPAAPRGQLKLNKHIPCKAEWATFDWVEPDRCIPVKGTGSQSLEVIKPWPVCKDGTEAKFATFDASVGTCDPTQNSRGRMRGLLTKYEVLGKCKDVRDIGSFAFWCNGAKILPPPVNQTKEGGLIKYPTKKCDKSLKPEYHMPDTCLEVGQGLGLEFTEPAVCANGTKAVIAGFKGKDCDPTDKPLKDPFTLWRDEYKGLCVPTEEINSMTFWCEGLPGVDMKKPNRKAPQEHRTNLGLILGLSLGLGGAFVLILGLVVAYNINWHFRMKVKELFGSGDGYIAL